MVISSAERRAAPIAIRWQWARMGGLAVTDLYALLAARQVVFAVEQECSFLDADGLDVHAWHLLGWDHGGAATPGEPVLASYLRLIDPGYKFVEPSIGRVLTTPAYRGIGQGRVLMREGLVRAAGAYPGHAIRIAAQQRLEAFYASLGFCTVSAPFEEDGIPHVEMLYPSDSRGVRG
jgi:ElaA protein